MSLIHWWPLNGDLKDKVNNSTISGTYTSTEGKIGLGLSTSTIHLTNIPLTEWSPIGTGASLSCWVKFNYNDIKTFMNSANVGYNTPTGNIIGSDSYGGLGLIWLGNSVDNFSTIQVMACVRGFTSVDAYVGTETSRYTMPYDEWVHLVVVANAQNKQIKMYVNGTQYGETQGYSSLAKITDIEKRYFTFNSNYVYGGNGPGYAIPMKLNDIRLYDHALGQAEIQELKKALIVHYTFDDILAESTTNLVESINPSSNCVAYNNGILIDWTTSSSLQDTHFGIQPYWSHQPIVANTIYSLSFDCEGINENSEDIIFAVSNLEQYPIVLHNGRNTITFDTNNFGTEQRLFLDDQTRSLQNNIIKLTNFQLEAKDHATPYTPSNRVGMFYNETGLTQPDNNTIQNMQLVTDAAINTYSLKCNNTKILTPITGDISQGATLSLWINLPKDNSGKNIFPSSNEVVVADQNSKLAFGFYNEAHGIITCNGFEKPIMTNLIDALKNDWNHIAIIRNGDNIKGYLNGVEYPLTGSQEWTHSESCCSIGCRYSGSWTSYYNGQVDDIRLYNTCLSPEEIKDLYNCGGRISNLGDALTGSFIEDAATAKVNKNHTIQMNEFVENDEGKASIKKGNILSSRQIIEI